ncbi:MAG: hypothetical protein ACOX9E_16125 [Lentisphaeria bacterium]|jgi:transcriptional regulator with XRE-family HTH domain
MTEDKNNGPPQRSRHRYPLSAQTRQRLRQKRYDLNLSFERLGRLLSVHWSTARKWENGETSHYSSAHHEKLQAFIAGDYDHLFTPRREIAPLPLPDDEPSTSNAPDGQRLNSVLRRIANLYQLAQPNSSLQSAIIRQLDDLSDSILARLATDRKAVPPAP